MNIIADIAGRFDELMLLLVQMPKDEPIVLVGDLMDRGPKSRQVIEWAMNTPNVTVIKGNHEDMMIDFWENTGRYEQNVWFDNGGNKTVKSYNCLLYPNKPSHREKIQKYVPKEHIEFLKKSPIFIQKDGLFISHAPWDDRYELGDTQNEFDILWNRYPPRPIIGTFQIFGHNSSLKQYGDYAICIDDCSRGKLTGIHWPSKQIFQQDYLK